jgi:Ca2+-binding RTX toxin-like protein
MTENANEGTDTVQASFTYTINTTLENLTLIGNTNINGTGNTGNNIIIGNNQNNTLTGLNGNDTLTGNSGNDTLIGGVGNDSLTGGSGQDFFTFNAPTEGIDKIADFNLTDDTIRVSATGFASGLIANASLNVNQFTIGSAATTSAHRFIYNSSTGALLFDSDGNISNGVTQIATLSTGLAMTNQDIFVTV